MVKGASAAGAGAGRRSAPPTVSFWLLSPQQVRITLTSITFEGATEQDEFWNSELQDCVIDYDIGAPTLISIGACGYDVKPGTYARLRLDYERTYQVLVDDPTNGFFSDASSGGLVVTEPPGGASFMDYTTNGGGSSSPRRGGALDERSRQGGLLFLNRDRRECGRHRPRAR